MSKPEKTICTKCKHCVILEFLDEIIDLIPIYACRIHLDKRINYVTGETQTACILCHQINKNGDCPKWEGDNHDCEEEAE